MLKLRRNAASSEEKDAEKFISPEEKQARIDEAWDKVRKNEWISKWIRGGAILAGMIGALIIQIVFYDRLPRELTYRSAHGSRGNYSLLDVIGLAAGALLGELTARILIRILKLEE